MRVFPLLDDVREVLLKQKEKQIENRRIFGKTYNDSDYIFTWQDGRLYKPDYITGYLHPHQQSAEASVSKRPK